VSLDRVDVDRVLVRLGIEAKKKGREWTSLCPNPEHHDRSPSFRVRDEPGSTKHGCFKCWPCQWGGTLVDLVQKLRKIDDYRDAIKWILEGVSVDQQEVSGVEVRVRPPPLRFRLPDEVVVAPLAEWPAPIRDYARGRGIEEWQVDRWGIGYAVEGRLKGRIVFVLRDARGRPRGYSARSFTGAEKRFLEPSDPEKADASAMFGEQHWPPAGERAEASVFLFEGAIKALAAEAALPGAYVAATTGSEVRPLHSTKLATFGRQCLVGDDDPAGTKVSSQLVAQLERHTHPSRLVLPRKLDADKLPREELGSIMRAWLRG